MSRKSNLTDDTLLFFPQITDWRERLEMRLSSTELRDLSKEEKILIRTMVEAFSGGLLTAIDKEGMPMKMKPKDNIQLRGQQKMSARQSFLFSMYMPSSNSRSFIEEHGITLGNSTSGGMKEIAEYITNIARQIPGSNASCDPNAGCYGAFAEGGQFSFTLSASAAKAMNKIIRMMNNISRGAGD